MIEIREPKAGKLVPLEGLRGIAAMIVMLGHMVRGLVPPGDDDWHAVNQVHRWALNGGAAVSVFFVLSGFILSLPFAKDRSRARVLTAMLKRWPRLALLTTLACLFSWAAIMLSQDDYKQAAAVTGNWWMSTHFNEPLQGHEISALAALREGIYQVFLTGDSKFDSPLWTMRVELFGSLGIFLLAPVLFGLKSWTLRLCIIAAAMIAVGSTEPWTYFTDFLVGTILALLVAENRLPRLSWWMAGGMGLTGIYFFLFSAKEHHLMHAPLKAILPVEEKAHFVWDLSAALFIMVLLGNPFLHRLFSRSWAVWLGLISFPIYLLHVPVMLSAGAASFLGGVTGLGIEAAVLLAAMVTIIVTIGCAVPLAWVDRAWARGLGRLTGRLMKRPPIAALDPS